jgi:hypothetical protein
MRRGISIDVWCSRSPRERRAGYYARGRVSLRGGALSRRGGAGGERHLPLRDVPQNRVRAGASVCRISRGTIRDHTRCAGRVSLVCLGHPQLLRHMWLAVDIQKCREERPRRRHDLQSRRSPCFAADIPCLGWCQARVGAPCRHTPALCHDEKSGPRKLKLTQIVHANHRLLLLSDGRNFAEVSSVANLAGRAALCVLPDVVDCGG